MARPKLDLGQYSEVDATPQRKVDGKWQRLASDVHHKNAGRWRARTTLRDFSGVLHDVQANRSKKRDAIAEVERKIAALLAGGTSDLTENSPLSAAAELWVETIKRTDSGLSASTVSLYTKNVDRYLLAADSPIKSLTIGQVNSPARIRAFLQAVADAHGTGAAKSARSTLSGILTLAESDNVIPMNALRAVGRVESQKPRDSSRDHRRAFTRDEWTALVDVADKLASEESLDPRSVRRHESVRDLALTMMATGTRITEARSVRWEDFSLDGEKPHIRLRGTKSKSARRRLDLPAWHLERLRARIESMRGHYLDAAQWAKHTETETRAEVVERLHRYAQSVGTVGYVFPAPATLDPERMWDQSNANNAVRKFLDAAGHEWAVPHTLRRSAITWLAESGAHLKEIADFAGHADPTMTSSVYLGRDFDGDKSELAAMLERLM